jgi:hypothetical protein
MENEYVERERKNLLTKVNAWFDEMVKAAPDINEGDCHTLELTGGQCGYSDDDKPLFTIRFKDSVEGSL